jgi:hypothetical protein
MDVSDVDALQLIFDTLRDYWKYEWNSVPMPDCIVLNKPMFRELYKWTVAHKRRDPFKMLGVPLCRANSEGVPDIALVNRFYHDGRYRYVWPRELYGQLAGDFS